LTHSFAKIVTKILANRLDPELQHLISNNQTTFVKKKDSQKSLQVKTDITKKKKNKKAIIFVSTARMKTMISDDGLRRSPRVKAILYGHKMAS
jgi:hypothetical protein